VEIIYFICILIGAFTGNYKLIYILGYLIVKLKVKKGSFINFINILDIIINNIMRILI
jgi:phosphate/sulfate permease